MITVHSSPLSSQLIRQFKVVFIAGIATIITAFVLLSPNVGEHNYDLHNYDYITTIPHINAKTDDLPVIFTTKNKAPNVAHFVIGLDHKGAEKPLEFYFYQYLAIKSAKLNSGAEAVHLHYYYKPTGKWFDKSLRYIDRFRKIDNLTTEIYGHPLVHFAHRSDVFRLTTLRDEGGIFIDLDMITLRSLGDLLQHDVVLGKEGPAGDTLLMSFTVAKKGAFFIKKWIESYQSFNGSQWNYHCCQMPALLAEKYPHDITILDERATAWPMWHDPGIKEAFFDRVYGYETNYVTHLWETTTKTYLRNLTAHKIWQLDTSLFCKLRQLTQDEEGAGVWSEDTRQNCQIVKGQKKTDNHLIGSWPLQNLTDAILPKIPDISGNRMHGSLSPLNSYDLVNRDAILNSSFFTFKEGDHIYLPMLPEATARHFTLKFWLRIGKGLDGVVTLISVEFARPSKTTINVDSLNGQRLMATVEAGGRPTLTQLPEEIIADNWYHLAISGNDNRVTFAMLDKHGNKVTDCVAKMTQLNIVKQNLFAISSIWLGRRVPITLSSLYLDKEKVLSKKGHFDLANVTLYDTGL